eukprot:183876-Rhodomonas_salina.1
MSRCNRKQRLPLSSVTTLLSPGSNHILFFSQYRTLRLSVRGLAGHSDGVAAYLTSIRHTNGIPQSVVAYAIPDIA